jgi:branched-subunit amino acid ABC-type transport system permease component
VAGAAGFVLERGVIRFLYGRPLETLLLTWGISLMIQQGLPPVVRLRRTVDVHLAQVAVGGACR